MDHLLLAVQDSHYSVSQKNLPIVDPLNVRESETIISASHRMHGERYGNCEELRFFTGLRQSEQFALEVSDRDLAQVLRAQSIVNALATRWPPKNGLG